jgi:hypothetical protein
MSFDDDFRAHVVPLLDALIRRYAPQVAARKTSFKQARHDILCAADERGAQRLREYDAIELYVDVWLREHVKRERDRRAERSPPT